MASEGEKFLYFLIGGFVGASIALLFAPKSGEETREYLGQKYREGGELLSQKGREGKEFVTGKSRAVTEKVTETIEQGKEAALRQKEQLAAAVEAGKQAYREERKKLETD